MYLLKQLTRTSVIKYQLYLIFSALFFANRTPFFGQCGNVSHYIVKNCDNHLFLLPNSCFHSHPWNHVGHVTFWPPRLVNYWKLLCLLPMGQEITCLCSRDHSDYEDSVLTMKNASGDVKLERRTALSDTAELLCQPWHLRLWTLRFIACLRRCRKANGTQGCMP